MSSENEFTKASQAITSSIENLEAAHDAENTRNRITGVPSGFPELDDLTSGWQPSDLIIIGGRPSMGKTSLVLSCIQNVITHPEESAGVAVFSLEMSARQLAQRMITSEARVDAHKARTGQMSDKDWQNLTRAAGELSEANIFIDDTPGLSVQDLRSRAKDFVRKYDIGLVVIDYLQLMQGDGETREQEIAHISRSLKGLAKELNLPVIALSQLNRAVENRGGDKRPQLSDLRESGCIEDNADVVAFIYRAERYGITVDEQGNSTEGIAEIIIEKQRNGPVGTVELAFVKQYARFENLTTQFDERDDDKGDGAASRNETPGSFEDDAPF